jgi:hypothetical protein
VGVIAAADRSGPDGQPGQEPDDPPDARAVLDALAHALALDVHELSVDTRVAEVCHDSLDLYCLYVTLDTWVPGFLLPRQLDLSIATLGDVHHYLLMRFEQRRG